VRKGRRRTFNSSRWARGENKTEAPARSPRSTRRRARSSPTNAAGGTPFGVARPTLLAFGRRGRTTRSSAGRRLAKGPIVALPEMRSSWLGAAAPLAGTCSRTAGRNAKGARSRNGRSAGRPWPRICPAPRLRRARRQDPRAASRKILGMDVSSTKRRLLPAREFCFAARRVRAAPRLPPGGAPKGQRRRGGRATTTISPTRLHEARRARRFCRAAGQGVSTRRSRRSLGTPPRKGAPTGWRRTLRPSAQDVERPRRAPIGAGAGRPVQKGDAAGVEEPSRASSPGANPRPRHAECGKKRGRPQFEERFAAVARAHFPQASVELASAPLAFHVSGRGKIMRLAFASR